MSNYTVKWVDARGAEHQMIKPTYNDARLFALTSAIKESKTKGGKVINETTSKIAVVRNGKEILSFSIG